MGKKEAKTSWSVIEFWNDIRKNWKKNRIFATKWHKVIEKQKKRKIRWCFGDKSDFRSPREEVQLRSKLERQKLVRAKGKRWQTRNRSSRIDFRHSKVMRRQLLWTHGNNHFVEIIQESATKVAGKARKEKESKLSDNTQKNSWIKGETWREMA